MSKPYKKEYTDEQLDKYRDLVLRRKKMANDKRQPHYDRWRDYYLLYRAMTLRKDFRYKRNNVFVPYMFTYIWTILARLIEVIFAADHLLSVKGREYNDLDKSNLLQEFIKYDFESMDNVFMEVVYFLLQYTKYGTGIGKYVWDDKKGGTKFKYVDIGDFWVDPSARTLKDARWVIQRVKTTKQKLKELQKEEYYFNVEKVTGDGSSGYDEEEDLGKEINQIRGEPDNNKQKLQEVTVLEMWERGGKVITLADEQIVIGCEENDYPDGDLPYVSCADYPEENNFYGLGEIEIAEQMQRLVNKERNQRLDNLDLINNAVVGAKVTDDLGLEDLVDIYPGKVIPLKGNQKIEELLQFLRPPAIGNTTINEERQAKEDMQSLLSTTDYTVDSGASRLNNTATGISIVTEQANKRYKLKADILLRCFIHDMGKKSLKYYNKFLEYPKVIRVTGRSKETPYEYKQIDRKLLDEINLFDVVPIGAQQIVNKKADQERLSALFDKVANEGMKQLLAPEGKTISISSFLEELLKRHDMQNMDDILVNLPQQPVQPGDTLPESQPASGPLPGNMIQFPGAGQSLPNINIPQQEMAVPGQLPGALAPEAAFPTMAKEEQAQQLLGPEQMKAMGLKNYA